MVRDIRKLREMAGWTQYALSTATGIERTRLSLIENRHVVPGAEEHAAIERALLGEIGRRNEQLSAVLSGA